MERPKEAPPESGSDVPRNGDRAANADNMSFEELTDSIKRLSKELQSEESEETAEYESLPIDENVSDEVLDQQLAVLKEQCDLGDRMKQLNRKAVNLGLLKQANKAPRCIHVKSNGKPCRAPKFGRNPFCVFHTRAYDTTGAKAGMMVPILENPQSVQIVLKDLMEKILHGNIDHAKVPLLLRSLQIANSTLKRKPARAKTKAKEQETDFLGNPI